MKYPTKIKGLSERRRLIPKGKIRLGIKMKNAKGTEYPKETEYFACHEVPEVEKIYGEKPTELVIMFPSDNEDIIFPQAYECYGRNSGLKCIGDGETATRFDENREYTEIECKTPNECKFGKENSCSIKGHLKFFIPKVGPGLYQIDVGSINSIIDINSGLDWARMITGSNFAMKPFILRRVPKASHKNGKKQTHYTLQLELSANTFTPRFLQQPEVIEEDDEPIVDLPDPEKVAKDDEILTRIYSLGAEKSLKNWEDIINFAYKTSVFSAEEPMTIDQAKDLLTEDDEIARKLIKKMTLIAV